MSAAMVWRMHDAVMAHRGGCALCGDTDEFSPDVEAFELTGKLICPACFEGMEEDNDHED